MTTGDTNRRRMSAAERRRAAERASRVFSYSGSVRFDDTDANGHVNNARYNAYCDEAAMQIFAAGGMNVSESGAHGIGAITRRAEYDYLGQLRYGDHFRVDSMIEFPKPTRIVFRHAIYDRSNDACVCRCVAYGLWMDFRTGRPYRLSDEQMSRIRNSEIDP
ncbi:MAG: thioesterase family protein [Planctomycetota bacterium]